MTFKLFPRAVIFIFILLFITIVVQYMKGALESCALKRSST